MNRTYEELCIESYQLQTNPCFQATQFFVAIFSIAGIILNLYVSIIFVTRKIFHVNLRILLINLLILLLLRSFYVVFRSSTFIYRMIAYEDQCSFLEYTNRCIIMTNFGTASIKCLPYAFIAITIERFIAMCFYQRYERWQCPIALVFLPLTWFQGAMNIRKILMAVYENQKIYKSYCSSITTGKIPYLKLTLEILFLIAVFSLLLITRIISKRKLIIQMGVSLDSLSSRYQIRENMKTSKTMFIATIMFIISALLNLSGTFLLAQFSYTTILHFAIFKEMVSFIVALFINAILILFIVRIERLHDKTINRYLHFGCCTPNRIWHMQTRQNVSGGQHMEIIEQIWMKGIRK